MFIEEKMSIYFAIKLSLREISFVLINDAKIMHSRDAQCNTEESPLKIFFGSDGFYIIYVVVHFIDF